MKQTEQKRLNYIHLINRFWHVNLEYNFTGNEAKLYFYLLHVSNSLGWKNPFRNSLRQINSGTGISINSIKASQKRLIESGLIICKNGKRGDRFNYLNKTQYTLTVSVFDTHTDTGADTDTDTGADTPPDTINKLNKTKQRERKIFSPPSLEEIQICFKQKINEKGLRLDAAREAEKFESHYGAKGWMIGDNKMKDWKKAVTGWVVRSIPDNKVREAIHLPPIKGMKR